MRCARGRGARHRDLGLRSPSIGPAEPEGTHVDNGITARIWLTVDVALDTSLLKILACPDDKGRLWLAEDGSFLYNPRLRRAYEVRDGIPVMLVDEARIVDDAEHARLEARIASGHMTASL